MTVEEARNELTFMAVGAYQEKLPPQKGAPIRLVLPWKYGFKSVKSVKRISFVEGTDAQKPGTFWSDMVRLGHGGGARHHETRSFTHSHVRV